MSINQLVPNSATVLYAGVLILVVAVVVTGIILAPAQATVTVGFGVLAVTGILQLLQAAKAAVKVDEAAVKVAEVAESARVVERMLDQIAIVGRNTQRMGEATHTLVNSDMGRQLKLSAVQARQLAILTRDQTHINAADEAERLYDEHVKKQNLVDSGPSPFATSSGSADSALPDEGR